MSVSGNQETGVYTRHSSSSYAGVPIKKRRFPMFQPNSPPQEESPSLPEEKPSSPPTHESNAQRQSSPSQESSILNASVVTSSAVTSDTSKNGFLEVKKESSSETNSSSVTSVQESLNLSHVNFPESNIAFDSSLPDNVDSKEKVVMLTGKSAKENVQLQTELHLTPTEAIGVHVGKEAVSKQVLGTDFKLGLPSISEGSVLSLQNEPTAFVGQIDGNHRVLEKLNPSSLSLSLSEEKCFGLLESDHLTSRKEDGLVHSDRCNWDLNTTMDAWDDSVGEAAIPKTVLFTGFNEIGGTHDIKSLSMLEVGNAKGKGKQIVEAGEHISRLPISSSSNQRYRSEDSLRLSLSTSFSQPNVRAEASGLSTTTDLRRVLPNSNVPKVFGSTGIKNAVAHPIVKSEPRDDTAKNVHVGASGNPTKPDHGDSGNSGKPCHIGNRVSLSPGKSDHTGDSLNSGKSDRTGDGVNHSESDHTGDRVNPVGLLDQSTVKTEMIERCNSGKDNIPTASSRTVVEPKHIKSEPVQEGNRERIGTIEPMPLTLIGKNVHHKENSSILPTHSNAQSSCLSGELVTQADLSVSGEAPNVGQITISAHKELQLNTDIPQEGSEEKVPTFLNQENKAKSNADAGTSNAGMVENTHVDGPETSSMNVIVEAPQSFRGTSNAGMAENTHVDGPETSSMNVIVEAPQCSRVHGEAGSEDEKVNISNDMLEEDSYDSDTESDGNKALVISTGTQQRKNGKEDEDYEDGEVRDPLAKAAPSDGFNDEEARNIALADCHYVDSMSLDFRGDDRIGPVPSDVKNSKEEDRGEINDALMKESADTFLDLRSEHNIDEGSSLQESVMSEMLIDGPDGTGPLNVCAPDECARSDLEMDGYTETFSDRVNNEGHGSEMTFIQNTDENIRGIDADGGTDSTLSKTEAPVNVNDTVKDSNTGGNRSRIIHLPRATNATSPYKTRSFPERSFGRERYNDYDGERMHPRRNRDETYADGPLKFQRDRYHGQSFRNYRQNYGRGRGRGYGRTDSSRTEWDSDRVFIPRSYNNDQTDFRFPRHKRNPAGGDEELECNGNNFMAPSDGDIVGSGRGGRKPVDEIPSFRQRRISPGARDGPANRGTHVFRRTTRNIISPSRSAGEDGSEFSRDDIMTQPPFEGLDRQFDRGSRNFSSGQRRGGGPRVQSIRPRTRSPGPWSSPRRRSPDGFNRVSEYNQRSPVMYRKERIRSPNLPCSPDEIADRRRGSPSFMTRPSNDSGRIHSHQRSVIPNRRNSSPDRVMPRRRFDVLEPRERNDGDDFFGGGGPPFRPTGRFHEVDGDGNGDDRRKFGERRATFRPPFRASGDADKDNFRFHPDDGPPPPRSFRASSPEANSEMFERSNARERDFDRRVKNRPGIQPRRVEQEGNYRQQGGGQVWHDEGFDDTSRTKRQRF